MPTKCVQTSKVIVEMEYAHKDSPACIIGCLYTVSTQICPDMLLKNTFFVFLSLSTCLVNNISSL